jgi:hypothetical protein
MLRRVPGKTHMFSKAERMPSLSPGMYGIKVTDIADAMILRRLLENLMDHGVVMVITSK